ncbi:polysaccharide pyruvyl transferase family protein [Sphingomonas piscis]|uniref:Polysaccharide pyruvyl transferase family protein n=1 Tax=Sphingomonas piscis TaxID=2714943 RepID=A0A6G7YRT9_9SPHN|nr:polysaccharide pyruvyl transferase family protein [Sphingomonas piscis]QIK79456.1 polysaccharide pyruvyl transferase family protein [Sphingomonas piscis]
MERQKIGVLTFHKCINYGSYWQARCLVEGLQAKGHDAVLLDHHSDEVARAEIRCAFQPKLPERSPRSDIRDYSQKVRSFLKAFAGLPVSAPFSLYEPGAVQGFDTIVIGSDEVWNLRHPWYGQKSIFYGDGLKADRLVSYAASFGNHDADEGLHPWWAGHLGNFGAISVRDENSRRLVKDGTGREPTMVLDPCLQFPGIAQVEPANEDEPYAVVYGHGFPVWFAEAVQRWASDARIKLLSIGYRNEWADEQRLSAGPDDFAALVAGARAVVTNFFHGCVFALLNNKPFATTPTPYRFNKVRDLTAALAATHHMVAEKDADRLPELLGTPLSSEIGERIRDLRGQSDEYLTAALA